MWLFRLAVDIEKSNKIIALCLFSWKTFYKNNFSHFLIFASIKKIYIFGQQKTIFSQWKTQINIIGKQKNKW